MPAHTPTTVDPSPSPNLRHRLFLALVILATLVARQRALSTPISGVRQTQSAMITGNLARDLAELGPRAILHPRIDYSGDQPGYLLLEFPLLNLAGVALGELGFSHEPAQRLPSLLLYAAMLPLLFAFVRARFGATEAVVAVLAMGVFPLALNMCVEPMPEQGATTAFVAGLYCFDGYLREERSRHLIAAAVAFAAMLLIKSTYGLLLLVPVALAPLGAGGLRRLLRPAHLVAGLACVAPLVAWNAHAAAVNRASLLDDGTQVSVLVANYLDQHGRWPVLAAAGMYTKSAAMLARAYGTWPLLLAVAGLVLGLLRRPGNRLLLASWLVSFALLFVALPSTASSHWYYTYGYSPLVALGVALALAPALAHATRLLPAGKRPLAQALLAVAALVLALRSGWYVKTPVEREKQRFGLAVQRVVAPRSLGIVSSGDWGIWDGELFYASNTHGWRRIVRRGPSRRPLDAAFVEEKRARGARFLAHFGAPEEFAALQPELCRRLRAEHAVLAEGPDWIVFSLED